MYKEKSEQLKEDVKNSKLGATQEDEFFVQDDFNIIDDPTDFLDKGVMFDEAAPEFDLKIPDEQALRPFFFMKLIQKTIQEGGFLTDQLYVPRAVWE